MISHDHTLEHSGPARVARPNGVAVATPPPPDDSKHPLLVWWPVLVAVLAAGGLVQMVYFNRDAIRELKQDVRQVDSQVRAIAVKVGAKVIESEP